MKRSNWGVRNGLAAMLLSVVGETAIADQVGWVQGIDLSHHNAVADWSPITSSDLSFVILKATDGLDYLDPTFADRFKALEAVGMVRGAYHFYETNDDPKRQAEWFIQNVPLKAGDLPPIVDIERVKAPTPGTLAEDFKIFLETIEAHYGRKPIIYTGPKFWMHVMKAQLPSYPLWIAEYGAAQPTIPQGWHGWTLWQYTQSLDVPGLEGVADGSHFNGDSQVLRAFLVGADPSR